MPAAAKLAPELAVRQPYPGLRPFETSEAALFFGRETHTTELLRRLSEQRFLAVVGSSGSGKSSLVRAGLLPALYLGRLVGATSRWRICVMRPGSAPLDNLAKSLTEQQVGSKLTDVRLELSLSSLGLARAVRETNLAEGESVLLVVDQFEELFRFARERKEEDGGAEARLFVASLLEATDASTAPLYVVLTMRSDFLGDCTQFSGLPNALNRSQYLIPQLSRDQVRDSIEKPARLFGVEMNPRLVERLLNDLGDDTSDLPVLQHALNRTYLQFLKKNEGQVLVEHYLDAGTLSGALDKHANAVLSDLSEAAQPWTERVFRALTTEEGRRKIRRPTRLDRLFQIVDAAAESHRALVREVIDAYANRENSLLVHSADHVIDISHESLITHWSNLRTWADDEAKSANWYQRAVDDTVRYHAGEARTWRDPELELALRNLERGAWNPAWADRKFECKAPFSDVKNFLELGAAEQRAEIEKKKADDAQKLADANALATAAQLAREAADLRANAEAKAKQEAEARAAAEEQAKLDAESRMHAESRAKEEALGRANVEAQAAKAQRRANRLLLAAGVSIAVLLGLFLWSQIRMNMLLDLQRNQLLTAQSDLQAKLGKSAKSRVNPRDGLHYVLVPAGSFKMGCSTGDSECSTDENPPHDVKISKDFWLGQTEVTQAAWKNVMKTDPSYFKGDELPVENVDWNQATKYCEAVGGRLPTEAEWEYAARAGSTSARYGELDSIAWYDKNSGGKTHEGGAKSPNQFGLFDMLGNVWEWVNDWYDDRYYAKAETVDPIGPPTGTSRVVRGGSWVNDSQVARASVRLWFGPSYRFNFIGFRCVGEFR